MQATLIADGTHHQDHHCIRYTPSESNVKHDGSAEHILRSSILKLLRQGESSTGDSSAKGAEATPVASTPEDIWAFRPKARGSRTHFKI